MKFKLTHKPVDPDNMLYTNTLVGGYFFLRAKGSNPFSRTGFVNIGFHHASKGLDVEVDVMPGEYTLGIIGTRYKKDISIKPNMVGFSHDN